MATEQERRLLRSYLGGPRIWDAAGLAVIVHSLLQQKLIEPCTDPRSPDACQITELGRAELEGQEGPPCP